MDKWRKYGYLLPPANEVWDKVICLQVCVCPQGGLLPGCLVPGGAWSQGGVCGQGVPGMGVPALGRGVPGPGGCLLLGGYLLQDGVPGPRVAPGGDIPREATAAGGTHPTGIYCLWNCYRTKSDNK